MKTLTLLLSLSLLLFPSHSEAHAWLKVKIATTEYAPYTSQNMEHNGYINHVITRAFLETGVIVEYTFMAWEDALSRTKDGEFDAISYGNFVRAREDEFWHSDPISSENLVFYTNNDSGIVSWSGLTQLQSHSMGITKGYLYTDELAAFIENSDGTVTNDTDYANLNALINGDIDIFPIDEVTGWYLLQSDFNAAERSELRRLSPDISTVTTHLLVPKNKRNTKLVLALFNKGLEQLTLQGEMARFKRLLKQGFYQNPMKPVDYDRR